MSFIINLDNINFKTGNCMSKILPYPLKFSFNTGISRTFFIFLMLFLSSNVKAQTNEAEWNGMGYSLKKIVSNTSIQSGVNFSYTIMFTAPAGVSTVTIQDIVPASLDIVAISGVSTVCGVTPVITQTGNTVDYSLTGLSGTCTPSGSFTIVVKFPPGTTCNGETARNRAGINIDDKWYYTPYLSTSAIAVDPWKISKSILSGAIVNPLGGSCGYLMPAGDTITYRISILKASPYYGNTVGQMNMNSPQVIDILPAGAILVTPNPCFTQVGSTLTWNPASPLDVTLYSGYAYYYCDIQIYYPAATFPNGTIINNEATLSGTMCNLPVTHTSNETCIEVADVTFTQNAYFKKYLYLTNRVPGCEGYYNVYFYNNGSAPLSDFEIEDIIPSGITVDQVKVYCYSSVSYDLVANSGAYPLGTGLTGNTTHSSFTSTIADLKLSTSGTFSPGQTIMIQIYFTVDPNPPGTLVTNCASFEPLANSLTLTDQCISFTVADGEPHPCVIKDICSPQDDYEPGDVIRFRLRVQNIGSETISGASIQDVLHSNFTYLGNEAYYISNSYNPPCSSGGSIPSGAAAWSGVSASHSGSNLSWSLPDIDDDCQAFYVAYCGYYGTYGLPYYYIEFDVEVNATAAPGVTPNSFDISGGNLASTETSNTVNVLVVASFAQEANKELSVDGGSTYASSGITTAGATANYRLNYSNLSNVPVTDIEMVDLLAMDDVTDDWLVLNRAVSRGSQFGVTYGTAASHSTLISSGSPPTPALTAAMGDNICLVDYGVSLGCGPVTWGTTPEENIKINYNTFSLLPGVTLREDFEVLIPPTANQSEKVCNDFAAISTASFLLDGVIQNVSLTPIAAPPVCLTIDSTQNNNEDCCKDISLMMVDQDKCCVSLRTKCEVDSVSVSIVNGTFDAVSWNCGTIASTYSGLSSYTFVADSCVLDMTACFNAITTGTVTVNYIVYLSNGQHCEKQITFDCHASDQDCCETILLKQSTDAAGMPLCCVDLSTDCALDSISVNLSNGIFSSVSWNAGALGSAYVGQSSYTFDAAQSIISMTTCVDAIVTGTVTISYTIYLSNGKVCEKTIKLDCEAAEVNCCDSIRVQSVPNPDQTVLDDCCIELTSVCDVDSVHLSVYNGTIASASWNCGTVLTGYSGLSSYVFKPNGCAIDLIVCFDALQTGVVSGSFTIYLSNGQVCQQGFELDCKVAENCCDSIGVRQLTNDNGMLECCLELRSKCDVDSVFVSALNGTISSASWNCGTIPTGYAGQSSHMFIAGGCNVDLITCFDAIQTGVVEVTYKVYLSNGEVCEKTFKMDCEAAPVDETCCALVDFKLKHNWPGFFNLTGMFSITNLDPSSPICSVIITPQPAGTFTTGSLVIDGVPSSQAWTPTMIPSSGTLSPAAVNSIDFSLNANGYKGVIKVCVIKCDGTECCFEFKWNKKPFVDIGVELEDLEHAGKLVAVTVKPKVSTSLDGDIKYVSFGYTSDEDMNNSEFYAISAASNSSNDYPADLQQTSFAYMGRHAAFFELNSAVAGNGSIGAFNLVFSNEVKNLGCSLFDSEGNMIFVGEFELKDTTEVTSIKELGSYGNGLFEFLMAYPNPTEGNFTIKYVMDQPEQLNVEIYNSIGQRSFSGIENPESPGVHERVINGQNLSSGIYTVVLRSGTKSMSKQIVVKER